MKVAFISDHLLGGGKERRLVAIVEGLFKKGNIEALIILMDGTSPEDSIAYKYVLELPIPFYYLGRKNRYQKIFALYEILKNEGVDAVNSWAPPLYSYLLLYSQLRLHIPVYNSSITGARDSYPLKEKLVAHSLSYISTKVNSNCARAMEVFHIPSSKSKVIYNGFNFDRLSNLIQPCDIRERFAIKTKYIVSMAGRYSNAKDWPTHVMAANIILDKGYDVTFLCMGGGDASPYIDMIDLRFRDRICFVGRQDCVESIYNASDIITLSTHGEGISNSILEGMALAKPIVATEGGGTPEIVEEGKSGYITKHKDAKEYAERIMQLLDDENLRQSMGYRGLEIVKQKFNIEQMIDNFEKLFLYGK